MRKYILQALSCVVFVHVIAISNFQLSTINHCGCEDCKDGDKKEQN